MPWGDVALNEKIFDQGVVRCHGLLTPIHTPGGDIARIVPKLTPDGWDYSDCINQRIIVWLATKKGERPIFPHFGCCIRDVMNQPLTISRIKQLQGDVTRELREIFPEKEMMVSDVTVSVPARNSIKIQCMVGMAQVQFLANDATLALLNQELDSALIDLGMKPAY